MDLKKHCEKVEWIRVVQMISYEDGNEPLGFINEEEFFVPLSDCGVLNIAQS